MGRAAGRRRASGAAVTAGLAALVCLSSLPAAAQEADSARVDTVPTDTTVAPQEPAARDTARQEGPPPTLFPRRLHLPDSAYAYRVRQWGREEILDSSALSLLDFLRDAGLGLTPLRSGYFGGPHHVLDGVLGPGFVRVLVDGRELTGLEAGQPDLSRVSLAAVDRIRVVRRGVTTLVEVTTVQHDGKEAYSRVGAGTGQPAVELLRGAFVNGLGDSFAGGVAVDFLNVRGLPMPVDRLDGFGRFGWIPRGGRAGLEVVWSSESVDRTAADEEAFQRSDLYLHGRWSPSGGVQAELWAGSTERTPDEEALSAGAPEEGSVTVDRVQLGLRAVGAEGFVDGTLELQDAPATPGLVAEAAAGVPLTGGLGVDARARLAAWEDREVTSASAGLTFRPDLGIDLRLTARGSTGERGAGDPLADRARFLSYDALTVGASLGLGPYRIAGRYGYRDLSRQLPFGADFDAALGVGPPVAVQSLQSRLEGPLLPGEGIGRILRVRGTWTHHDVGAVPVRARYVPADLAVGELLFRDRYFEDNLEVRLGFLVAHRSALLSARPEGKEPELLASETRLDTEIVLVVDEVFRIWWRPENLSQGLQSDFPGLPFPVNRNVFGVTWEFHN